MLLGEDRPFDRAGDPGQGVLEPADPAPPKIGRAGRTGDALGRAPALEQIGQAEDRAPQDQHPDHARDLIADRGLPQGGASILKKGNGTL